MVAALTVLIGVMIGFIIHLISTRRSRIVPIIIAVSAAVGAGAGYVVVSGVLGHGGCFFDLNGDYVGCGGWGELGALRFTRVGDM